MHQVDAELAAQVERLSALAKAARWADVWQALAGEHELAAACSRYAKPSSGWSFLHQAAHAGDEASARTLVRLGAALSLRARDEQTAADVARQRGHHELARVLDRADERARGLWAPPQHRAHVPSSSAWDEATERRAWRELQVAYADGVRVIPAGARHFVDPFGRMLLGWHGSFDPPAGMDGESML